MSEELSAATSYTEDDFYCPVCQEVLKTPVRTAACQHVKCFLTAMRESGIHCPLCRGSVTRRERACPERALDLENIMRRFSGSCRCCSKKIKFYRMRHHYKSCKKYQDEYGVSSVIPNFKISQDSVRSRYVPDETKRYQVLKLERNRSETSASDNTETYQEDTSFNAYTQKKASDLITDGYKPPCGCWELNSRVPPEEGFSANLNGHHSSGHPTFKCPLCQESNFTRQRLLDHCNSNHLFQIVPVNPSQITRNFVSHLNQRHQFDYGEFVNLQLDEETQYQTAVEESFQVNM
ncbi:E3 ubiquitin-protein ligase RNF138 [Apodemus speciosus]|uniref:E3 ubiquitin-protein ligase RNF138 n=1 Tax=Apodemus speciosus TaxID=105296 RepID=A0ABQ0FQG0_APOSI